MGWDGKGGGRGGVREGGKWSGFGVCEGLNDRKGRRNGMGDLVGLWREDGEGSGGWDGWMGGGRVGGMDVGIMDVSGGECWVGLV